MTETEGFARPESAVWAETDAPARLWDKTGDGTVRCRLSPRGCRLKPGQLGYCGVRKNIGGELRTLNYGKSIHATQEFVETEALYHFAPGAKILSMGNIGCMMNCSYCHNWRTSQSRLVRDADVHFYTPESVVDICLAKDIPIVSWTYNDPVVWQEFVVDTARLARRRGILNLYKSAFYISEEAATELLGCMDVFSLSLKSMDPAFYRRLTQGRLEPVLEAIKLVYRSGRHLEISNLMVTGANDTEEDARKVAAWVLTNCSAETPLHFVRFHPDYRYTHVARTPVPRLLRAREVAMEMGLKYVYVGNVFNEEGTHTACANCGRRVIERFGMNTRLVGVGADSACRFCGHRVPISALATSFRAARPMPDGDLAVAAVHAHDWSGDVLSFHVEASNDAEVERRLAVTRTRNGRSERNVGETVLLRPGERYRFVLSRSAPEESRVEVESEAGVRVRLFDLLDRAHFPTEPTPVSIEGPPALNLAAAHP